MRVRSAHEPKHQPSGFATAGTSGISGRAIFVRSPPGWAVFTGTPSLGMFLGAQGLGVLLGSHIHLLEPAACFLAAGASVFDIVSGLHHGDHSFENGLGEQKVPGSRAETYLGWSVCRKAARRPLSHET